MSEMAQIVDTLEFNVHKLTNKIGELEQINATLRLTIEQNTNNTQQQTKQIEVLIKDFDALKITNSLLGSDEYKRETKLKINSLIREIDYCIAQLSD